MERVPVLAVLLLIAGTAAAFTVYGSGVFPTNADTEQPVDRFNDTGNNGAANNTAKGPYVTITFDDGYRSQYIAAQELEERGMHGVFFVATGQLNGTFEGIPTMTPTQVQDLHERGHEIGGHTYNHTRLDQLTTVELAERISQNQNALQDLGITPVSFAYPYGAGVDRQDDIAPYYAYARQVRWQSNSYPAEEPLALNSLAATQENYQALDPYLDRLGPEDWLIVSIHHVATGNVTRRNVDINETVYEQILDSIAETDAQVVTFQDLDGGA